LRRNSRILIASICLLAIVLRSASSLDAQVLHLNTSDGLPITKTQVYEKGGIVSLGIFSSAYINLNELKTKSSRLLIYSKGYDTLHFKRTGLLDTVVIQLIESAHLINSVLVSSSKSKKKYKDIPTSLVKINPYLIENRNNTELTEVINQIPSVSIVDNQASIRGGSGWSYGSGSRVMVSIDGLPALSGDANQVQWQFLDMQNIESIEVLKGASSVLYGSSALNGTINIQSKEATDSLTGSVNTYFGFYDKPTKDSLHWSSKTLLKYGLNSYVAFKKKKMDYVFTTVNVVDNGYRMAEESNRSRLGAHLKYHLTDSMDMGLKVNGMYNNGSTFLLWESGGYGYTALDSSFNENVTQRLSIDPYFNRQGKKVEHHLLGRYFLLDNDIYQADTLSQQSNSSSFAYVEYRGATKQLLKGSKLTYGVSYSNSTTNSPLFQGVQKASNAATYLQVEERIKNWFFSAGVRYEQYKLNERTQAKPVLKFGATYNPKPFTILRGSYGEGYRFPSIAESFIATSVGPVTIYPNADLRPESAWNAEVGIKQGFKVKGLTGYADLAFYYSEIKDMIEFTFAQWAAVATPQNSFGAGFKSINTGRAIIQGVDFNLLGSCAFKRNKLTVLAGYNFNDPRNGNPSQVIATDSQNTTLSYLSTSSDTQKSYLKYRSIHTVKGDLQWDRGPWSAGLSVRYTSYIENIDRAFITFPIGSVVPGVEHARQQGKKGNLIMDLRLSKAWNHGFKTAVIVNNIQNKIVMERPADLQAPRYFMLQVVKKI